MVILLVNHEVCFGHEAAYLFVCNNGQVVLINGKGWYIFYQRGHIISLVYHGMVWHGKAEKRVGWFSYS